jgi:uncharacterized protein (TIGR04222 family)
MNLTAHSGLWSKIQHFPLNDPNATITFAKKLASQQKWSETFTERVIEEYRKFIFLCCISPRGASPSYAVDQAWHLHLTYTKSYWIEFCQNTLEKDIHHAPSSGGEAEDHRHENWYAETLILYETTFGYKPPADIWPPLQVQHSIVVPEITVRTSTKLKVAAILLLPFLINFLAFGTMLPYWLKGQEFLIFYPLFVVAVFTSFAILRQEKGKAWEVVLQQHFPSDATVFQTAQFLYGNHRATPTAIVDLLRRNLLEVTKDKRFIIHNKRYIPLQQEQNPLIPAFKDSEDGSKISYTDIYLNWHRDEGLAHPGLQSLYLLTSNDIDFVQRYWMAFVIALIAGIRILQGLGNGYPVIFLIIELIISLLVSRYILQSYSPRGLFFKKAKAYYQQQSECNRLYADDMVSDFAANGAGAIRLFSAGLILASLFRAYPPVNHGKWDGSGTACSSDSSDSSCSGGSSCGGGGCGGCGGGD